MPSGPFEKCRLINKNAPSDAPDHSIEAVGLRVEYEVPEATWGRPGVVFVPVGDWYQAGVLVHRIPLQLVAECGGLSLSWVYDA